MNPYFKDETVTLYHGDALEILPRLEPDAPAFGFTDPPYNVGMKYGYGISDDLAHGLFIGWTHHWIELMRSLTQAMAVYVPAKHTRAMWNMLGDDFRQIVLTWTPSGPIRNGIVNQHATILTNASFPGNKSSGLRDVWENMPSKRMGYAFHEVDYEHPGATSEGITRKAIGMLGKDAELVIDPFAGTGTSLVIAKERGLRAIGIEKSEKWAEVAAKRLQQTTAALI